MLVLKLLRKYRTCFDILVAFGITIALIVVIIFTSMIIKRRLYTDWQKRMDSCRYKVVLDLLFAFVSFVAFMWLIYLLCSLAIQSSTHEKFTTDYIVQVSVGLSVGVVLFAASIVYFCLQYRNYTRKKTNTVISVDSTKYKPITVLAGSHCAICLTEKDTRKGSVVSLSCKHAFHKDCVQRWIDKIEDVTCPVCRMPATTFPKSERDKAVTEETSFLRAHNV